MKPSILHFIALLIFSSNYNKYPSIHQFNISFNLMRNIQVPVTIKVKKKMNKLPSKKIISSSITNLFKYWTNHSNFSYIGFTKFEHVSIKTKEQNHQYDSIRLFITKQTCETVVLTTDLAK